MYFFEVFERYESDLRTEQLEIWHIYVVLTYMTHILNVFFLKILIFKNIIKYFSLYLIFLKI